MRYLIIGIFLLFFSGVNAQHHKKNNFYLGISSLINVNQSTPEVGTAVSDGLFNPVPAGESYEYLVAYRGVSYFSVIAGYSRQIAGNNKYWFGLNMPVEFGGHSYKIDIKQGGAYGDRFENQKGLFSISVPIYAQLSFNRFYEDKEVLQNGFTLGVGPKLLTGPLYFYSEDSREFPDISRSWVQFGGNIGISFTDRNDHLLEVNLDAAYGAKKTTNWGGEQYSYSYKLSVIRYF